MKEKIIQKNNIKKNNLSQAFNKSKNIEASTNGTVTCHA